MIHAFKNGVSRFDEDTMNGLIGLQGFRLVYDGMQCDGNTGDGITENSIAEHSYCTKFTLTGATEISRIELEIDKDAEGSDLLIEIRSGMEPAAGIDGTLLKFVVMPKEFIPTTAAWVSIPICLSGLTSDGTYWIKAARAGDAVNKIEWIGEETQDANYPAYYRVDDSGNWTEGNALHFKVFSGENGELVHGVYGNGFTTVEYDGEIISKVYRYLPPADGVAGGIRDVMTYTWSGEYLKGGDV